ncbi:MAG: hypothetical protein M3R15_21180 [Acidobacteriota bacterium]|nr:hypothetical protein [Acidobacteriota bacterium]
MSDRELKTRNDFSPVEHILLCQDGLIIRGTITQHEKTIDVFGQSSPVTHPVIIMFSVQAHARMVIKEGT